MIPLYDQVCHQCSKYVTSQYSTSFSGAIRLLHQDLRKPVYDIYAFVRLADEIVDTFHEYNKEILLQRFEADMWQALEDRISLNPVLHSFQDVVHHYGIPSDLIHAFLHSMKMDLYKSDYDTNKELDEYIYGSAEVVGLMCLCVFCEGDLERFEQLKGYARKLGAAFQKINFLRDLQADNTLLNRNYFPELSNADFNAETKKLIEQSIEADFHAGLEGIRKLPWKARLGVYTAYRYYHRLYRKIKNLQPETVLTNRVRVPDIQKLFIVMQASMYNTLNII